MGGTIRVGTPPNIESAIHCYLNFQVRLMTGPVILEPFYGFIWQAETCQNLSLAEEGA